MNIEKLLLSCVICIFFLTSTEQSRAQNPEWIWAKGSKSGINSKSVTVDGSGNVYFTGISRDTILTLDSKILLRTSNPSDMFLVKCDPQGKVLWARAAGGKDIEEGISLTTDKKGNVFVAGRYASLTIELGTSVLKNRGLDDVFIAKYDSTGNVLWARTIGSSWVDNCGGIATDHDGNLYITGYFQGETATLEGITLKNEYDVYSDIFIAKYNPQGAILWAKSAGGVERDEATDIAVDSNSNVYITGFSHSLITYFGSVSINNITHEGSDVITAKYDSNGKFMWAKIAGSNYTAEGRGIAADGSGNAYVTGFFEGPSSNSTITFETTELHSVGAKDVFIVKYDPQGKVIWTQTSNENSNTTGSSIITDRTGNVYVAGTYSGKLGSFGSSTVPSIGNGITDIFLTKFTATGNLLWTGTAVGNSVETAPDFTVDNDGQLYVTGSFRSDSLTFGQTTLTKNKSPQNAMYIAKFGMTIPNSIEEKTAHLPNIFPTPANDIVHITGCDGGQWSINIYTMTGNKIYHSTVNATQASINLSGFAKGYYIFELQNNNKIVRTGKLLLE